MFNWMKKNNIDKEKYEEKWIWVDGYKGTNKDMCCQPGNTDSSFQYEMNKEFICYGDIIYGQNGFHFSKDLDSVFNHYPIDGKNRFFKVKGLMCEGNSTYFGDCVAKKIIFESEIKYQELETYIKKYLPFIKNEKEYINYEKYDIYCRNIFINKMKDFGFSDIFINIIYDKLYEYIIYPHRMPYSILHTNNCRDLFNILHKYIIKTQSYFDEGISKDLMVYLLEQYKKELINC